MSKNYGRYEEGIGEAIADELEARGLSVSVGGSTTSSSFSVQNAPGTNLSVQGTVTTDLSTTDKGTLTAILAAVDGITPQIGTLNITASSLNLNTDQLEANIGATSETTAATDGATSGLNGLIKRFLARFTTLLGILPAARGQSNLAGSVSVAIASDQTVPISGTIQPGSGTFLVDNAVGQSVAIDDNGGSVTVDDGGGSLTVDGSVAINNASGASAVNIQDGGNSITVDGTVTANLGTLNGAATEVTLGQINTKVPSQGQALSANSLPVVLPAAQITTLTPPAAITGFALDATLATTNTEIGATNEAIAASDTATSGLNGLFKRFLQRYTTLLGIMPSARGQSTMSGSLGVAIASDQSAIPVNTTPAAIADTGLATIDTDSEAIVTDATANTAGTASVAYTSGFLNRWLIRLIQLLNTRTGDIVEVAPASDTASSGLNGRLQRIAQRLSSAIALLPASLGQGTMATSFKVVLPSDQSAVSMSPSATSESGLTTIDTDAEALTTTDATANSGGTATVSYSLGFLNRWQIRLFQLLNVRAGDLAETAPASDTASSGLNGRLQRIAQRLTSLIALLPSAIGQSTMSGSLGVAIASDQSAIPVNTTPAAIADTGLATIDTNPEILSTDPTANTAGTATTAYTLGFLNRWAVKLSQLLNVRVGDLTETAPASDTASSGLNGRLQRIAQLITALTALLPAALGQGTMAQSFRVVLPSNQSAIPVNSTTVAVADTGLTTIDTDPEALSADATANTAGTATVAYRDGFLQRWQVRLMQLTANYVGALTETAPASDTASSGLNGRLQRIAQRVTSLIALIPTALGQGTMATSFKVVLPSDQSAIPVTSTSASVADTGLTTIDTDAEALSADATANTAGTASVAYTSGFLSRWLIRLTQLKSVRIGDTAETAPASDTASSGLNGRLQRIAQRVTSLIALFPTALGQGTMATSFKVVLPSDQSAIAVDSELPAAAALADAASNPTTPSVGANNLSFNGTTWDRVRSGVTGVISSFTGYVNSVPIAKYNSTQPAPTNGQGVELQVNANSELRVTLANSSAALTRYTAMASSAGANVKASAAQLFSLSCTNLNTSVRYFQVFNSTASPSGTPLLSFPVYGGGGLLILDQMYFGLNGRALSTGLSWGISTAAATYTAATAADTIVEISYL
jgi:hypothetical protein